jgi:hypothetical protein
MQSKSGIGLSVRPALAVRRKSYLPTASLVLSLVEVSDRTSKIKNKINNGLNPIEDVKLKKIRDHPYNPHHPRSIKSY